MNEDLDYLVKNHFYYIGVKAGDWVLLKAAMQDSKTLGKYNHGGFGSLGNVYKTRYENILISRYQGGACMFIFDTNEGMQNFIDTKLFK